MKIYKNEIQNLNQKPEPAPTDKRHPQVLKAAKMYEQTFLNEMVKAMRNTVSKSDLIEENMAEKIFKDQLYDKHVETWTDHGGIGLADIIYEEVMEKYQAALPQQRVQGPIALEQSKPYALPQEHTVQIEQGDGQVRAVELKPNGLYGVKKTGQKSSDTE